jgi:hypothetical protein
MADPNLISRGLAECSEGLSNLLQALVKGTRVIFPDHLYMPEYGAPLDLRVLGDLDPTGPAYTEIFRFTAPDGAIVRFTHYAIFNDGLLAADYDFLPEIDGRKIFEYQGDPADRRIYLGVAPDLSNTSLIESPISMQPGQTLTWRVRNSSAVTASVGVRMKGYVDRSQSRKQQRFGG